MMRLVMLLMVSSILIGCGVPRPDTNIFIVNAEGGRLVGYNLKEDYDEAGNLKPGVKPRVVPVATLGDLNKWAVTDPDGLANLKAYVRKVREAYEACKGEVTSLRSLQR